MPKERIVFIVEYPDWMAPWTEKRRVEFIARLIVQGELSFADQRTLAFGDEPEQSEDWICKLFTGALP